MNRFEGKVAFVTGAAAGIGRATGVRLAREGASVYLVDVAAEGLEETAKLCEEIGADVAFAVCDISSEDEVKSNVQACVDRFGRLDTLCNIAGIWLLDHFENSTPEQFRRVLAVNNVGTGMLGEAALAQLPETKGRSENTD